MLTLALALVCVAWLCAPIRHWWWVLALLMLPHWVLVSAACGGWWWVLVLALALAHDASLHAPVGGGCSDLFMSPRWVLVSAIGGDGAEHSPLFVASLRGTDVACLSVGGVLLDVYETGQLTIG